MDRDAFIREYEKYSLEDLTTIYTDQAEMFSPEERDLIYEMIQKKEHPLVPEPQKSMLWLYILSLLCFPVGLIVFFATCTSHDKVREKVGLRCELCAIVGALAFFIIWANTH
ncbi:MAG: hypothetical protein J6Z40_10160 [Oscillospiraceae bacterium]|nr:hypothetical protein [Oscillospiraceae bacterium]